MAQQMYLEMPLKPEHAIDFCTLCNSENGLALSKQQPGFISAEWMVSTSDDGKRCFHLWEKWETVGHFDSYMQTPDRASGSDFETAVMNWAAGKTRVFWGEVRVV